jgi:pyridoxal phosphate enzyme (YggS family)
MSPSVQIAENLRVVRAKIDAALTRSGRPPGSVRLLAVTKTIESPGVRAAIDGGQLLFGENYVQEGKRKLAELGSQAGIEFHFIGALQRNKAKDAVGLFHVIQTVDRTELADRISECAAKKSLTQKIFVQVNISREITKSGADEQGALTLIRHVQKLPNLELLGLMCIGSYFEPTEPNEIRRSEFQAMRRLQDELVRATGASLPELSMGMSHDYELAAEEGATIVRVGTAIFGERPPKE